MDRGAWQATELDRTEQLNRLTVRKVALDLTLLAL